MKDIVVLKIDKSLKLRESDIKFIQCIKKAPKPITEDYVVNYYVNKVNRLKGDEWRYDFKIQDYNYLPKDPAILRSMALQWFDRNLGKMVRKGLVIS